jgi:hypothetical protein
MSENELVVIGLLLLEVQSGKEFRMMEGSLILVNSEIQNETRQQNE